MEIEYDYSAEEADAVQALIAATRAGADDSGARASAKAPPKRSSAKAAQKASLSPMGASSKSPKTRWRILPSGQKLLEAVYAQTPLPSSETRDALATQLGATPRQVQVWFQNKRQRSLAHTKRGDDETSAPSSYSEEVDMTPSTAQAFGFPGHGGRASDAYDAAAAAIRDYAAQNAAAHLSNEQQPQPPCAESSAFAPPPATAPPLASSHQSTPPDSPPPTANNLTVSGTPPSTHFTMSAQGNNQQPIIRRNDSLADLAEVAECVESMEQLAGGLQRVGSLKDLANDLAASGNLVRVASIRELVNVASLKDLVAVQQATAPHMVQQATATCSTA